MPKEPVRDQNFFYVKLKNSGEHRWEVLKPKFRLINHSDEVMELEAHGAALEVIRSMFPALTPIGRTEACWFGDLARTIFANL